MRRFLFVLAACGGESAMPPPTGPITAHVTHYDFKLDLDPRAAHSTLTLAIDQGGDCVTLPMRAMSPTAVTLDGVAAKSVDTAASTLAVCGQGYATGATLTLDADETLAQTTLAPSDIGFSTKNDAQGNPFTYLVSWVGGCDRFGPCDNGPDKFATYH